MASVTRHTARVVTALVAFPDTSGQSEFWAGTGSAIIGALLAGTVAVGAAFLAAWLARRHDRTQLAHQAIARLSVVVYDTSEGLSDHRRADYGAVARRRVMGLERSVILEVPFFTEKALMRQVNKVTTWMTKVWLPALERRLEDSEAWIADLEAGGDTVLGHNVSHTALSGTIVLYNLTLILHAWQTDEEIRDLAPFPALFVPQADANG